MPIGSDSESIKVIPPDDPEGGHFIFRISTTDGKGVTVGNNMWSARRVIYGSENGCNQEREELNDRYDAYDTDLHISPPVCVIVIFSLLPINIFCAYDNQGGIRS